jgi:hypothetical protein
MPILNVINAYVNGFCFAGCPLPDYLIRVVEDAHKGLLGDLDGADAFHALFAFLLAFEDFHFAGNIPAVKLGGNVFAEGLDCLPCDDFTAYGDLQWYLELVARYGFSQPN